MVHLDSELRITSDARDALAAMLFRNPEALRGRINGLWSPKKLRISILNLVSGVHLFLSIFDYQNDHEHSAGLKVPAS